jgi:hypothetical protein
MGNLDDKREIFRAAITTMSFPPVWVNIYPLSAFFPLFTLSPESVAVFGHISRKKSDTESCVMRSGCQLLLPTRKKLQNKQFRERFSISKQARSRMDARERASGLRRNFSIQFATKTRQKRDKEDFRPA